MYIFAIQSQEYFYENKKGLIILTQEKGKRALIINNIKSSSIEQAIFILKSPECGGVSSCGRGIVAEAQEIINSYINTIEKNQPTQTHKKSVKSAITAIISAICLAIAVFIVAIAKN